jgi:DNA-binding GntR family transcriptional regulator
MTQDELREEIVSMAIGMDDEFGQSAPTVTIIAELLHVSHTQVRRVLHEVPEFG